MHMEKPDPNSDSTGRAWRTVLVGLLIGVVGCAKTLPLPAPPAAPPPQSVIVTTLPVVVVPPPLDPPEAVPADPRDDAIMGVDAEPHKESEPVFAGGSDPFRSDTVDDNKTGEELMNHILSMPASEPEPAPEASD
jgi:hypothetical protein